MINLKLTVVQASNDEMTRDKVFACDSATPFFAEDYATWAGISADDISVGDSMCAQIVQHWLPDGYWMVVSH